jgi:type III restriction enzyme
MPAVPVIVGISATPGRFTDVLAGSGRTTRPVDISPEEVRASGLIKERVLVSHPEEEQPGDITLLREAVREWLRYTEDWRAYCEAEGDEQVVPVLVVQVEDGDENRISRTDLERAINAIRDEARDLPDEAFSHAFQDHGPLTLRTTVVRYLAPSDIADDPDVRVVFFKTSLNVGWDCPRGRSVPPEL